ncbi:MAG: universal stress protein [Sulfuricella sp.]|nr:universal stress protein [Sulfuricella sp.]
MENYRHVLVATDLSEACTAAALRGADLARRYGARLTLLHVIEHFPEDEPTGRIAPEDVDPTAFLVRRAEAGLEQLAGRLERKDAEKRVVVTTRSAQYEILRFVGEAHADLILLAFRGPRKLPGLLGSTAGGVVGSASCDVMVIHPRPGPLDDF